MLHAMASLSLLCRSLCGPLIQRATFQRCDPRCVQHLAFGVSAIGCLATSDGKPVAAGTGGRKRLCDGRLNTERQKHERSYCDTLHGIPPVLCANSLGVCNCNKELSLAPRRCSNPSASHPSFKTRARVKFKSNGFSTCAQYVYPVHRSVAWRLRGRGA